MRRSQRKHVTLATTQDVLRVMLMLLLASKKE
jgi:hypothetical protein